MKQNPIQKMVKAKMAEKELPFVFVRDPDVLDYSDARTVCVQFDGEKYVQKVRM